MKKRSETKAAGVVFHEGAHGARGARTKRPPLALDAMIAREHKRVTKLAGEMERLRRRLARARMRFSVLTRLAADEAKRQAGL